MLPQSHNRRDQRGAGEAMFLGTHVNGLDVKGRASVPADFRAVVRGEGLEGVYCWPSPEEACLVGCGEALMGRYKSEADRLDHLDSTIVPALREERIDWGVGTPGEVLGGIEDGSLTALAVLAPETLARFPEVPPVATAGVDVDITLWRGIVGPPNLSQEQQRHWEETLHTATRTPPWQAYLERGALADAFLGPAAFGDLLEREDGWYREQLGRAGMLPASSAAS